MEDLRADRPVVYVVDDDDAVRDSAALLLEAAGYGVRTYASGIAFLLDAEGVLPGCVLLDIHMPQVGGLEVQDTLRARGLAFPVIVLTGQGDVGTAVRAMKNGACEFLEKPYDADRLLEAVEDAFHRMAAEAEETARVHDARAAIERLSGRESEVLQGLLAGLPNKLIAYQLGISIRTVEIYRANVMEKMGAKSLSVVVRMALDAGIEPLG